MQLESGENTEVLDNQEMETLWSQGYKEAL